VPPTVTPVLLNTKSPVPALGIAMPPLRSVPIRLPWNVAVLALISVIPVNVLSATTFPSPTPEPPTVTFEPPEMKNPTEPLPNDAAPVMSVPIRLPRKVIDVALLRATPLARLPDMTFPSPGPEPPIVLFAPPPTNSPSTLFDTAVVPAASVPSRFPRTIRLVSLTTTTPLEALPEITLSLRRFSEPLLISIPAALLGTAAPPVMSVPTKFCWTIVFAALLIVIPVNVLPEITFPVAAARPPITVPVPPEMNTPTDPLGIAAAPEISVPTRFRRSRVPVVLLVEMPVAELPEITFPAPLPIFVFDPPLTKTPIPLLANAALPARLVPIRFSCTRVSFTLTTTTPLPLLPEIRLSRTTFA